ncbi:uncharacterized protein LOC122506313 [Leptopilina heterotoma]|uniref:uncharacterized protein LOC122506313 n=1 Tax=Leptopilina heterotoma TaxID=63436 RepID=UPI001CA8F1AF|nr:uncharacterized protein LOC122506313 [Leptopilina heterotoma]
MNVNNEIFIGMILRKLNKNNDCCRDCANRVFETLNDAFKTFNFNFEKFDLGEFENPHYFLERIDKFFVLNRISIDEQLTILKYLLHGKVKTWFHIQQSPFIDINDFKIKFLNYFFSIPIQVNFKLKWYSRRFIPKRGNLQSYFMNQIYEAQYLFSEMDIGEIFYRIIQQMPNRVKDALVTVDYLNFDKILQSLVNLDLIYQDKQNARNNECKDFLNYAPPLMPLSCMDFGKLEQSTKNLNINDNDGSSQESLRGIDKNAVYRGIEFTNFDSTISLTEHVCEKDFVNNTKLYNIDDFDFQMNINSCNNSMNDSGIDLEIEESQINQSQENSRDEVRGQTTDDLNSTSEEYSPERKNIINDKFCDFYNEKFCTEKLFDYFCLCKKMLFDMNSASSLTADKDFKFRLIASRDLEPDKDVK